MSVRLGDFERSSARQETKKEHATHMAIHGQQTEDRRTKGEETLTKERDRYQDQMKDEVNVSFYINYVPNFVR